MALKVCFIEEALRNEKRRARCPLGAVLGGICPGRIAQQWDGYHELSHSTDVMSEKKSVVRIGSNRVPGSTTTSSSSTSSFPSHSCSTPLFPLRSRVEQETGKLSKLWKNEPLNLSLLPLKCH